MLVSRWCYQSGLSKVISQLSLHVIGCKTRVKFVISHWSVSIHLLLVVRSPFVGFVFVLDKSFRVVRRFLSSRFHPKSRRLFPFYFSNITLRTDLLTFRVTSAVIKIASEMRRLPAYFDNPGHL